MSGTLVLSTSQEMLESKENCLQEQSNEIMDLKKDLENLRIALTDLEEHKVKEIASVEREASELRRSLEYALKSSQEENQILLAEVSYSF